MKNLRPTNPKNVRILYIILVISFDPLAGVM